MFSSNWINHNMNNSDSSPEINEAILWADVESSGTIPETDYLLEFGAIISDMAGNVISNPWETLFEVPNLSKVIAGSDFNVQKMHDDSELWSDLWRKPAKAYKEADEELYEFISYNVSEGVSLYFGGNSITLDRVFMKMHLPKSYSLVSYRSIDVTSLSMAIQSNTKISGFEKGKAHRGLKDALDSLEEYKYYLNCLKNI